MKKLIEDYIYSTLGPKLELTKWHQPVPLFLKRSYDLYIQELLGTVCIFMVDKDMEDKPATQLLKHIELLKKKADVPVVYVNKYITPSYRERLIKFKIPFIIPGNQMYLPPLGLDLREYYKTSIKPIESVSPSTQAIILFCFLNKINFIDSNELKNRMTFSRITINRAFNEIAYFEIGKYIKRKGLEFNVNISWEELLPILKSTVLSTQYFKATDTQLHYSGECALAEYSSLSSPPNPVFAISKSNYNTSKLEVVINNNKVHASIRK